MPLAMMPRMAMDMMTSTKAKPFSDFWVHRILISFLDQCPYSGQVAQGSNTRRRATPLVTRLDWLGQPGVISPVQTWAFFIDTFLYIFFAQPHTTGHRDLTRTREHITGQRFGRSEEHTSELQSRQYLVCR